MRNYTLHWTLHPDRGPEYYEKQKQRMTEDEIARELDISYDFSVGNIVYKEFTKHHIIKGFELNPELKVIRIADYGVTCAALFLQLDQFDRLRAFKEIVLENSGTHELGKAIQAYSNKLDCQGFMDFDDPAGSHRNSALNKDPLAGSNTNDNAILANYGFKGTHFKIKSIPNREVAGIQLVKLKLSERIQGQETIQIDEDGCPILVEAMQSGYKYKLDASGERLDVIDGIHPYEDVCDCLRYACLELYTPKQRPETAPKPISQNLIFDV